MMEISEFSKKKVKKIRVIDGKKVVRYEWEYKDVPKGYKVVDGKPVKMSAQEQQKRSKAAKKAANKSSTKSKRAISVRRRKSLVKQS